MNLIKLALVSCALISAYTCAEAEAGELLATWTVPTQYVDGTPIPPTSIRKYELRCVGVNTTIVKFPRRGTKSYRVKALCPGSYSCAIRVYDTRGTMSEWSRSVIGVVI